MSARGLGRFVVDVEPLRHRAFRRLWLSTVVTTVGSQLTAVAVPKQVFDDTGSSAWVGVSGAVALVPLVVFGLWGGSIADALDRRTLLLVTNAGIALTSLGLWLQAAADSHSVWGVLVLLALQQACFGLNAPARGAAVPRLVPGDLLTAAAALSTSVSSLGLVLGPLLAGVLIPVVGLPTLYLVDTVGLLVAVLLTVGLPRLPPLARAGGEVRSPGLRSVLEGGRYLLVQRILLVSFLADVVAMVFGMPRALFPELAERSFGDPPGGGLALGVLYAAIPLGAGVAGLLSGTFTRVRLQGRGVVLAVAAWGLAVAGFGLAGPLWLGAVFLALAGVADLVSSSFRGAILQQATTDEMRGRMQGFFIVVVAGGPRLADLLHGTLGDLLGPRVAVTGGGLLVVVAIVLVVSRYPDFWRYQAPGRDDDGRSAGVDAAPRGDAAPRLAE
ncbi:MFS transporter [Angustibacter aerolatus]